MEGTDLLYSGLMFAAGMLSLWTLLLLLTAALFALAPSLRKSFPEAATISPAGSVHKYCLDARSARKDRVSADHALPNDGAAKTPASRSLSEALSWRPRLGRVLRLIQ
jgi:hypothetical protein